MATNDFLPFGLDQSSNVVAQADWVTSLSRQRGFQAGIARSAEVSKAQRQASFIATVVAQLMVNLTNEDQLDNGDVPAAVDRLRRAIGLVSRIKLTAPLNLYVSTTGSDQALGLTPATPLASLQAAWNSLMDNYDLNGHQTIINIAPGTYTQGVICTNMPVGAGSNTSVLTTTGNTMVQFLGNGGNASLVIIDVTNGNCFAAQNGAAIMVSGVKLRATGSSGLGVALGVGLQATTGAVIAFDDVIFDVCYSHMIAAYGGAIFNYGHPYFISGSVGRAHFESYVGSSILIVGCAITITNTVTMPLAFAFSYAGGYLYTGGCTFTNPNYVTGSKYNTHLNGVIETLSSGNINFLPGSTPGTNDTGGQYD